MVPQVNVLGHPTESANAPDESGGVFPPISRAFRLKAESIGRSLILSIAQPVRTCFVLTSWVLLIGAGLSAQQPVTFQYFYDDSNQLVKVVDSTGNVVQYVYDVVGNIVQINRSTLSSSGTLSILNFTPQAVPAGATLTIQGQGFSANPSADIVTINGTPVTVLSATPTTLVVRLPLNATTGTISVTVAGVTTTSDSPVTILPLPIISSITPKSALAGTSFSLTVTGLNLTGSSLAFSPPSNTGISAVSIAADGTSATMKVSLTASAQGRYTLIATNATGPSDSTVSLGFIEGSPPFNTLTVPGSTPGADPDGDGVPNAQEIMLGTDPLNPDTDGDGYPDGLEVALGSDPLNPKSIPNTKPPTFFSGPIISALNGLSPAPITPALHEQDGPLISVLDSLSPPAGPTTNEISASAVVSVLNAVTPSIATPALLEQDGFLFSVFNGQLPQVLTLSKSESPLIAADSAQKNNDFLEGALLRGSQFVDGTSICRDSDGDGLCDEDELLLGTDPYRFDTDGDGFPDGLEVALGSDPLNRSSIPNTNPSGPFLTPTVVIYNSSKLAGVVPNTRGKKHVEQATVDSIRAENADTSHHVDLRAGEQRFGSIQ